MLKIDFPGNFSLEESTQGTRKQAAERMQQIVNEWKSQFSYAVQVPGDGGQFNTVRDCKLVQMHLSPTGKGSYLFETPQNKAIWVYSTYDFELQK